MAMVSACRKADEPPAPSAGSSVTPPAVAAPAPAVPAPPPAARTGYARRCSLEGDPVVSGCIGGNEAIAVTADDTLLVTDATSVRRYRRVDGEGCRYAPVGEPVPLPAVPERMQSIGGPVYMRSGGPAWSLTVAGDVVYAHDFLAGLYRLDDARFTPVCTDVFGYRSVAARGKELLAVRGGIVRLVPGRTPGACTAKPAKVDDAARGELHAIDGALYMLSGTDIARRDADAWTPLATGTRACSIVGLARCGDGLCLADSNCMQVVQLDATGTAIRTLDDDQLFGRRPYGLDGAATRGNGALLLRVNHRDVVDGKDACEAAVYELPAALFAR